MNRIPSDDAHHRNGQGNGNGTTTMIAAVATAAIAPPLGDPGAAPDSGEVRFHAILAWLPDEVRNEQAHARFHAWARRVVDEKNPKTALEEFAVARLLEGAWRLQEHMKIAAPDVAQNRARAAIEQALSRAEQSWARLRRLAEFERRAEERRAEASQPRPSKKKSSGEPVEELPADPLKDPLVLPGYAIPPELPEDAPIDWRDYIALDPSVNREWPVIRGTTVKAEFVAVSIREQGISVEELLAGLPFLTRTQVRAALACDDEGACGPIEPTK